MFSEVAVTCVFLNSITKCKSDAKKKTFLSFCVAYLKIVNFPYMVCFWEMNGAGVSCAWVSLTEQDHSIACPMVVLFSVQKSQSQPTPITETSVLLFLGPSFPR